MKDSLQDAEQFSRRDERTVCVSLVGRSRLGPKTEFRILRYTKVITFSVVFNRVVIL